MSYSPPSFPTTSPTGALGMNEIVGVLKEIYDNQVVEAMTYSDNPFLAMVRKDTGFGGKLYPLPVITDSSQGRSSSFTYAQTNQSPMQISEFMLTRVSDYSIAQITHEAMLAAKTDKMAFIRSVKTTIDQAIQVAVNSLASACFRDGTGTIGAFVNTAISTGVITLDDPNSVVQFAVGQVLESRATAGGTISTGSHLGYVIAVNRSLGKLTVSATSGGSAGTPTSWSQSFPYLNVQGDANSKVTGLQGWITSATIASNDSFFSVNRFSDPTRLGGIYYNGANQSIEEALIDSSSLVSREGGKPDVCIVSYASYSALEKSLGARAVYTTWEGPAEIAFRGIMVNGANSQIKVFPDRNCPGQTGWLLTMKSWVLASLYEAPHIFDYDDNLQMLRIYNADAAELRVGYYAQLGCNAPGWNAQVALAA